MRYLVDRPAAEIYTTAGETVDVVTRMEWGWHWGLLAASFVGIYLAWFIDLFGEAAACIQWKRRRSDCGTFIHASSQSKILSSNKYPIT